MSSSLDGVPTHLSAIMPGAHDHHLRMLDMAAFLNQAPSSDAGLILDPYNQGSFTPAAALYASHFGPTSAPRIDPAHQITGFMNGMMKVEAMEGGAGEQSAVTNVTSASGEVSGYSSSGERETTNMGMDGGSTAQQGGAMGLNSNGLTVKVKVKRKLPGMPDPDAEVVALSPKTLLATNRFVCEICNKGFQRDQNLQLHRRGHNLPWKLKQRGSKEVKKKVYVCPEVSCVHHDPVRALGDLTGIKKHFSRKHGEKKWKCDKCSKRYAVQSDWKAHSKTCGTREYRCDCGTLFSRRDSFITHRAFCDALAEESALRVQNQINGSHAVNGDHHLSNTLVAQLAAQGSGAASFGSMIGGSATCLPAKNQHHLLEISPFDNNFVGSASAAGRARLPLWLTAAAAAGNNIPDHQQLLASPNAQLNLPLNSNSLLSSFQGNAGSLFFSGSGLQSPSGLGQAGGAAGNVNGMIGYCGNHVSEFDILNDSTNAGFAGLSSLSGLAGLTNPVNNPSLYNTQSHVGATAVTTTTPLASATSLLQKAAQMGSVSSTENPNSLFKSSLGTAMAPISSTDALYWPQTSSNKGPHGLSSMDINQAFNGGQSSFHGDKPTSLMMSGDARLRSSFLQENSTAIQEMVASFNNGGATPTGAAASSTSFFMGGNTHSTSNLSSKAAALAMANNISIPILSSESHGRQGILSQQTLIHHDPLSSPNPAVGLMMLPMSVKTEDSAAAADNFTRDFLGVRGENGMLESMEKSLPQRSDLHGIDYHHNYSNAKENLSSEDENMSDQSHVKPWDQN